MKAHNITVERLHCPSPRNVFSVIEEQTKELDRNQVHSKVVQFPFPTFLFISKDNISFLSPDW